LDSPDLFALRCYLKGVRAIPFTFLTAAVADVVGLEQRVDVDGERRDAGPARAARLLQFTGLLRCRADTERAGARGAVFHDSVHCCLQYMVALIRYQSFCRSPSGAAGHTAPLVLGGLSRLVDLARDRHRVAGEARLRERRRAAAVVLELLAHELFSSLISASPPSLLLLLPQQLTRVVAVGRDSHTTSSFIQIDRLHEKNLTPLLACLSTV
jgi:hypothetical protein